MSDFNTTQEIAVMWKLASEAALIDTRSASFVVKELDKLRNQKWIRADKVKKEIEDLIKWRDNERKNNNIFRMDSDELNEDFISELESLKIRLGLLDDAHCGEGHPSEELLEVNSLGSLASEVLSKTDVSGLPTNKFLLFKQIDRPQIKTKVFYVYSVHSNVYLGSISWDAGWRRYTMNFEEDTKWSIECIAECYKFITKLMQERGVEK